MPFSPRRARAACALTSCLITSTALAIGASAASAAITPVGGDAAGATTLANAMLADPTSLTTAGFDAVPPSGTPNGTADAALSFFPTNGTTFGILTSGDVNLADDANTAGGSGTADGGGNVRGTSDRDVTVLKLDLQVPTEMNCMSLDFAFYSDEFPEFVGSGFNDAFIAELDTSDWTTAGSVITAPSNFAFDPSNQVISINSTGATAMSAANAAGTTYDGATPLLQAKTAITPGAHTLYLSIFDQGDSVLDSAAFVDNVRFGHVDEAQDCAEGAVPVETKQTQTTYSGDSSVQYSDAATLSGNLQDISGTPAALAGQQLDFTLGSQTASAGPTDASGDASTSLVVDQQPGSVSTVETAFAGAAPYLASSDSDAFAILKEDCTLGYSGDTLVLPLANTTLAADLGEPDSSLGDLSGKTVTFTVTDAAANVQTFTAVTDAAGHASTSEPLGSDVYGVAVAFAGDDFYTACETAQDTLVTVQSADAKVTGGGWISIGTGRTNFGFNVIPEAGGLYKGQFQLRARNGKDRFHADAVSTLSVVNQTATWTGTGKWNGESGYTYTVKITDNGTSGKKGDTISIVIKSPSDTTVYSSGGSQALKGGNIVLH